VWGQRHAQAAPYPGKDTVPILQEGGWASGSVWTGAEKLAPTGIRSPDRPARRPLQAWGGLYTHTNAHARTHTQIHIYIYIKGKAVPLQALDGPEGSRKLMFPDFMTTAGDGGKVVSLRYRPPLLPGITRGTHSCYRLSRPQGHSAT
jgi:hypothetical protein